MVLRLLGRALLLAFLLAPTCGGPGENCYDGEDNDGDGLVDGEDDDCPEGSGPPDHTSSDPPDYSGGGGSTDDGCCKTCGEESQACGDSCIALYLECHIVGGCACEG